MNLRDWVWGNFKLQYPNFRKTSKFKLQVTEPTCDQFLWSAAGNPRAFGASLPPQLRFGDGSCHRALMLGILEFEVFLEFGVWSLEFAF